MMSTTELILTMLKTTSEDQWDEVVLSAAQDFNKTAFQLPEKTVESMYRALAKSQSGLNRLCHERP